MSSTQIDIINNALIMLGEELLDSINDNVKAARAMKRIYQMTKDAELRAYNWNFAMARTCLPKLANGSTVTTDTVYAIPPDIINIPHPWFTQYNKFQIPSNCLKIVWVGTYYVGAYNYPYDIVEDAPYRIMGRVIYARETKLDIRYVQEVDDTLFDSLFVEVLSAALAVKLADYITQSPQKYQVAQRMYETALEKALAANAIEMPPQPLLDNSFIVSRL